MNVLLCNPPWRTATGRGLRAGASPPRLVEPDEREVPWPYDLASAAGWLREQSIKATVVDSIATGESDHGFLDRAAELDLDAVAIATSGPSLASDLVLIGAVAAARPVIVLWPGKPEGAEALLAEEGVRAVVCGEYEYGLLAALRLPEPNVYPADPVRDLDQLPRPYRDYTVHLYRLPLAGVPAEPQLHIRVSRGPDRWRGLESIADEIAFCRRNYPRLTQVVVADPGVNANPERFAALAAMLTRNGTPWLARVAIDQPGDAAALAEAAGATALEVALSVIPDPQPLQVLAELRRGGVALTLAPTPDLDPGEVSRLARETGALAVRTRPPEADPTTLREALFRAQREVGQAVVPPRSGRVYIVGIHLPDYMPPGLVAGAREAGWDAMAIDVFDDPRGVRRLLASEPDDIAIFDRGLGLPADIIRRIPARTVLYSPEVLPTIGASHPHAERRYREFAPIASAFDDVVLHDAHPLEFLWSKGHDNIRGVVILPYNAARIRDLGLPRDLDVVFVGSTSPHREEWIEHLRSQGIDVAWPQAWGEEFVRTLNRAKIILNLHFTPLWNTELRIVEALACGAFVVSEEPTQPSPFIDGEHLVVVTRDDAAETIRGYLAAPADRERIARQGQAYVAAHHTSRHCVEQIVALLPERT